MSAIGETSRILLNYRADMVRLVASQAVPGRRLSPKVFQAAVVAVTVEAERKYAALVDPLTGIPA